jgi:hypothetical protein
VCVVIHAAKNVGFRIHLKPLSAMEQPIGHNVKVCKLLLKSATYIQYPHRSVPVRYTFA